MSLSAMDPMGKVVKMMGGGFFVKIGKKVDEIMGELGKKLLELKSENRYIGKNGPRLASKTIKQFRGGGRIDIENPNPGIRPGQLHYQQVGDKNKYYFNFEDLKFHIGKSDGPLAGKRIQKLLDNEEVVNAIIKGKKILDGK